MWGPDLGAGQQSQKRHPHKEKCPQLGNPLWEGKPGLAGESGVLGPEPGGKSLQGLVGTSATVQVRGGWQRSRRLAAARVARGPSALG